MVIEKNTKGFVKPYQKTNPIKNRQDYEKLYAKWIYLYSIIVSKKNKNYYNNKTI